VLKKKEPVMSGNLLVSNSIASNRSDAELDHVRRMFFKIRISVVLVKTVNKGRNDLISLWIININFLGYRGENKRKKKGGMKEENDNLRRE